MHFPKSLISLVFYTGLSSAALINRDTQIHLNDPVCQAVSLYKTTNVVTTVVKTLTSVSYFCQPYTAQTKPPTPPASCQLHSTQIIKPTKTTVLCGNGFCNTVTLSATSMLYQTGCSSPGANSVPTQAPSCSAVTNVSRVPVTNVFCINGPCQTVISAFTLNHVTTICGNAPVTTKPPSTTSTNGPHLY
ncbi:hypothetical protein TWF694_005160 [Orbilia ellipsospora]|uniref:Uncharacterized protein n=1 Tax=Orbilia ellipsospora TaxID=2528407 RepID=A0AAV9WWW7_9PEZI